MLGGTAGTVEHAPSKASDGTNINLVMTWMRLRDDWHAGVAGRLIRGTSHRKVGRLTYGLADYARCDTTPQGALAVDAAVAQHDGDLVHLPVIHQGNGG